MTSAACGGESCRNASSSAASTSLEMASDRSEASSASGAACSVSSSAAPIELAAASSARNSVNAESSSGRGTQPPPKCAISESIGAVPAGIAQVRLEQQRPVGEERPHQHARILVVGVEMPKIVEHAGADALHAREAHVARGFRKPRHGRYIGIVTRRTRVVRGRELGCETLELVGERCEEILSSHRCVPCRSLSRAGRGG